VAKVIQAAEQAFRQGLEVAMILAGAMLLAAAAIAARSNRSHGAARGETAPVPGLGERPSG